MSFVNERFTSLNPFNKFHLCRTRELAHRRIHQLLETITRKGTDVGWHRGWGNYIGTPQYPYLGKIGLNYWRSTGSDDWSINLSFIIADTTAPARALYQRSEVNLNNFMKLAEEWNVNANFHIGFMQSNLVFFETDKDKLEQYIKYWATHSIKQVKANKDEPNVFTAIDDYLDELSHKGIIKYGVAQKEQVEKEFGGDKKRSTANIRPGISVGKNYKKKEVEELDKEGQLENRIKKDVIQFFDVLIKKKPDFLN